MFRSAVNFDFFGVLSGTIASGLQMFLSALGDRVSPATPRQPLSVA
jgi:hypothetical protein